MPYPRIPTGFRPKAQGCAARATLGHRPTNISNRNAVVAIAFDPSRHIHHKHVVDVSHFAR